MYFIFFTGSFNESDKKVIHNIKFHEYKINDECTCRQIIYGYEQYEVIPCAKCIREGRR